MALFADFVPCAVLFLIVASLFPCLLFNGQSNYLLLVLFLHIFPSILSPQSSKDHLVVKKGEQGKLCGTGSGLNPLSSCKGSGLKDDIEVIFFVVAYFVFHSACFLPAPFFLANP